MEDLYFSIVVPVYITEERKTIAEFSVNRRDVMIGLRVRDHELI